MSPGLVLDKLYFDLPAPRLLVSLRLVIAVAGTGGG